MAATYAIGGRDARASCRICGQPSLPAVRLCAQCKAALKRVRHDTVSQQMPMSRRTRGGDRSRRKAREAEFEAIEGLPRRAISWGGIRFPLVLGAMVAIVGSAGYFIVRQIHAATPPDPAPLSDAPVGAVAIATQPRAAPVNSVNVAPSPPPTDVAEPAGAPPVPAKPRSAVRAKAVPVPMGPPAPEAAPEPPPPPVVVAAAPPPPAPRPLDKMQLLAQAFAQCPQESLLPRMICEQKARLQFCDGYWGRSPQCPNGAPENNSSH